MAFIRIHILYHAQKEEFFGLWMIEELQNHGYSISPGTLYPILHNLKDDGLLKTTEKTVEGKNRKYYHLTEKGEKVLGEARSKISELSAEVME